MKHYGDITKLDGHLLPMVDVVCGGSPCQDLSVAGQREGLAGERSGLFMEQIRIIKEMRERGRTIDGTDNVGRTVRWMVWENVPGAFSSNGGEDFRIVLEETARIKDKDAAIPRPAGKWTPCGCIVGNGYSIAWRTHDAQYHGVPQRRRRICLLADFDGYSAPRILFELRRKTADSGPNQAVGDTGDERRSQVQSLTEGLPRNTEQGGAQGQGTAEGTEGSSDSAVYGFSPYDSNAMKSGNPHSGIYKADTSRTLDIRGGDPSCQQGGWL